MLISDEFCLELIREGNDKAITDLLFSGYTEIINLAKGIDDLNEEMSSFIHEEVPQLLVKRN